MITATARKHVVRALREALRIREGQAGALVDSWDNSFAIGLDDADLRGVKAMVVEGGDGGSFPRASLYLDKGRGYEALGVDIQLDDEHLARWRAMPNDEARAIGNEIMDRLHVPRITPRAFDNDDMLPEEMMNAVFGPVPEPRDWKWVEGMVLSAEVAASGDHVVATVLVDGVETEMTMIPVLNGAHGTRVAMLERIGVPGRLCVGRLNAFDHDHPAGIDRSRPLLDMFVAERDVPGLTRLYAHAA